MSSAVRISDTDQDDQVSHGSSAGLRSTTTIHRLIAPVIVMLVAAVVYGSVYFREVSVPTGVGANLVPAERVLKGEVPYRDFYKIQTPGILLLNAGLFRLWGTSLLTAMRGVLFFKVLTLAMVFIVARLLVSWKTALLPTVLAFVWLPPGGPFRAAPIQYEMLFILIALYFTLRWGDSRKSVHLFAAGLAIGIVALFKQNVGVYLALALFVSIIADRNGQRQASAPASVESTRSTSRALIAALAGLVLPIVGLLVYLVTNRALGAALRVFIRGPAEHIQMKLTGYPLPKYAAIVLVAGAVGFWVAGYVSTKWQTLRSVALGLLVVGAATCALIIPTAAIDNSLYWFAPALFIYAAWRYLRDGRNQPYVDSTWRNRQMLLILLLFAAASYAEVFPRSVRGLVIGTLPPAFILLTFLLGRASGRNESAGHLTRGAHSFGPHRRVVLGIVSVVLAVFALRIVLPHYFDFASGTMKLRADTELNFARGRGVYLPADRAAEVNSIVGLIRSHVPSGGYFFAHALDATPYYFLTDRNSPTGATLWNDAGTSDGERARTMQRLKEKDVQLVVSSAQALAAERYGPLADLLHNDFHESTAIGRIVFLERNY